MEFTSFMKKGNCGDMVVKRIVRIGTHKRKMDFDEDKAKPSDRSIFRRNIGGALLNKDKDSYLEVWEIDFLPKKNRIKYGHLRDIEKEKSVEQQIREILRNRFFFRLMVIKNEKIGNGGLESKLIGTVNKCKKCKPSENWLGNYSPKEQIRISGLWLVQHLNAREVSGKEMKVVEDLVCKTETWIRMVGSSNAI